MADPDAPFDSAMQGKPRRAFGAEINSPNPKVERFIDLNQTIEAILAHESYKAIIANNKNLNLGTGDLTVNDIVCNFISAIAVVTNELSSRGMTIRDFSDEQTGFIIGVGERIEIRSQNLIGQGGPIDLHGEQFKMFANQNAMHFNNSSEGEFVKLGFLITQGGKTTFTLGTSPLDVNAFCEQFADNTDVALTATFQDIVQGTLVNTFNAGNSVGDIIFRVNNTTNQVRDFEYYISINDAAPGANLVTAAIGKSAVIIVSDGDSIQTTINPGDTISVKVRDTTGAGNLIVEGTILASQIQLCEQAIIINGTQFSRSLTADSQLKSGFHEIITGGTNHDLPVIILAVRRRQEVLISNDTGGNITINGNGANIKTLTGSATSVVMAVNTTYKFREEDANTWRIVASHK